MITKLMENYGEAEVIVRRIATTFGPLKRSIKRFLRKGAKTEVPTMIDDKKVANLRERLRSCGIEKEDIVIIHSSIDGLRSLGMTAEEIVDLLLDEFSDMTIVFAAYPIEPLRVKEIYKYNPSKTLCWTGMLPNVFLKREGVCRSLFPYNTLAAKGTHAEKMMKYNLLSDTPHGSSTAWDYCRLHHAKILFLGTTSREANTMAIHMAPDILGERWPVKDWYSTRKYLIETKKETIEKIVKFQSGFWYQFVNEYKTDRILKDNGILKDISVEDIPIEIVSDSFEMMEFLIQKCEKGELMYTIPKKYLKHK